VNEWKIEAINEAKDCVMEVLATHAGRCSCIDDNLGAAFGFLMMVLENDEAGWLEGTGEIQEDKGKVN